MVRPLLADKIYLPINQVSLAQVKANYSHNLYRETQCAKCDNKPERFNSICATCPGFLGRVNLWNKIEHKGHEYVSVPSGDPETVEKVLKVDLSSIKDLRPDVPFKHPIKFVVDLYEGQKVKGVKTVNQKKIVRKFLKFEGGQLSAPPRSGKCVSGDTLIITENGIMPISSLFLSNHLDDSYINTSFKIASSKGWDTVAQLYKNTVLTTYKITNALGHSIEGTADHPLLVMTPNLKLVWRKLSDLKRGDQLALKASKLWPKSDLATKEQAALMGYMVANGYLPNNKAANVGNLTTSNYQIQYHVQSLVKKTLNTVWRIEESANKTPSFKLPLASQNALVSWGLKRGLAAKKEIPASVLCSSEPVVRAFLSAYFSCDSYIPDKGDIELCTASRKLATQLQVVLQNYGIWSRKTTYLSHAVNSNKPVDRRYWSLFIAGTSRDEFLSTFSIKKDIPSPRNTRYDNKYLVVAYPYVREALQRFSDKHSKGFGNYLASNGKNIKQSIPFIGHRTGKNLVSRTAFKENMTDKVTDHIGLYDKILRKRLNRLLRSDYVFSEVVSIKKINKTTAVYDVVVPNSHSFVANGIISHNTAMGTYIFVAYGQRTLVLVKSDDLARQFMKDIRIYTNVDRLERKLGKPVAVIAKKDKDFIGPDIVVANYQKFIHKDSGRKRLKQLLLGKFGTVIIDEVHNASANAFSKVINSLDCKHKVGLSATLTRKDMLHLIVGIPIIGPSRVNVGAGVALVPRIEIIQTKLKPASEPRRYDTAMSWLSNNDARNKIIVRKVFEILRSDPKRCILIPTMRVEHTEKLAKLINRQAAVNNDKRGENWNTTRLALPFHRNVPREQTLKYANAGKGTRVMVGLRQMIGEFHNVPVWTDLIHTFLFSNEEKTYQLVCRPCTPMEGKPQPVIWTYVDDLGLTLGMFRATFLQNYIKSNYPMTDDTRKLGYKIINGIKNGGSRFKQNTDFNDESNHDTSNIKLW